MLLALTGCVPVPYLLPPSDFSIAVDPRPVVDRAGGVDVPRGPEAIDFRAGIVPLSPFDAFADRTVDPSLGFVAAIRHPGFDTSVDLGGYGRVAWRAWRDGLSGRSFLALEPRATLNVLSVDLDGPGRALGLGADVGVAFRIGGRCEAAPGELCLQGGWNAIGVGVGEWGLALAVDLGMEGRPEGLGQRALLSLELRAPAGAGVVLVPVPLH